MKLIIDSETYEVSPEAAELILKQTREYAKPGIVYAVKKGDTVELLNETADAVQYERQGFNVLRK